MHPQAATLLGIVTIVVVAGVAGSFLLDGLSSGGGSQLALAGLLMLMAAFRGYKLYTDTRRRKLRESQRRRDP